MPSGGIAESYGGFVPSFLRNLHMGRGKERVRCMERVTWKLILPYVK